MSSMKSEEARVTVTNVRTETGLLSGIEKEELIVLEYSPVLVVKRFIDIIGSAVGLVILSPFLLVIAILIKLDSKGPVIFKQTRVGFKGRLFTFYKFRSMRDNAHAEKEGLMSLNEATGPIFKMKEDPRLTRVGIHLRKLSLDELPQLVNVLKGEMSLVGPRPPLPEEVEDYSDWELQRLLITPGITGLWQVSGRSELPFEEMVRLDCEYIKNWSLWQDLKIMAKTIPAILTKKGAY